MRSTVRRQSTDNTCVAIQDTPHVPMYLISSTLNERTMYAAQMNHAEWKICVNKLIQYHTLNNWMFWPQ